MRLITVFWGQGARLWNEFSLPRSGSAAGSCEPGMKLVGPWPADKYSRKITYTMEFVTENLIHSSRIRYQSAWTGVSVRPGHNVSGSDTPPPPAKKKWFLSVINLHSCDGQKSTTSTQGCDAPCTSWIYRRKMIVLHVHVTWIYLKDATGKCGLVGLRKHTRLDFLGGFVTTPS